MLRRHPQAATDLLIEMCTSWHTVAALKESGPSSSSISNENRQFSNANALEAAEPAEAPRGSVTSAGPERSNPKVFFSDFVDEPSHFRRFLQSVADKRWGQRIEDVVPRQKSRLHKPPIVLRTDVQMETTDDNQQQAVWNTLLELYLDDTLRNRDQADTDDRARALALLEQIDRLPLDPVHALMLCSAFGFEAGLMCLWERLGMYEEIMRFWKQRMDSDISVQQYDDANSPADQMLHYLHIYGPTQPNLYPMVLRYITTSPATLARHTTDIRHILDIIQQERIVPPLAVIQLLSRNDVTNIGVVKDWLKTQVADTRVDIDSVSLSMRSSPATRRRPY